MDPNVNLDEQRKLVARSYKGRLSREDTARLAELVEALDRWLTHGGALPARWTR